jgi:hypothetical protein
MIPLLVLALCSGRGALDNRTTKSPKRYLNALVTQLPTEQARWASQATRRWSLVEFDDASSKSRYFSDAVPILRGVWKSEHVLERSGCYPKR